MNIVVILKGGSHMRRLPLVVVLLVTSLGFTATVFGRTAYDRLTAGMVPTGKVVHTKAYLYSRFKDSSDFEEQYTESWVEYGPDQSVRRSKSASMDRNGRTFAETQQEGSRMVSILNGERQESAVSQEKVDPNRPDLFQNQFSEMLASGLFRWVGSQELRGQTVDEYVNESPIDASLKAWTGPYIADLPGDVLTWTVYIDKDMRPVRSERFVSGGTLSTPVVVMIQDESVREVLPSSQFPNY